MKSKLRDLDTKELVTQTTEMQERMFRIRFQMAMGQSEGMKNYRELRKERARALTLLRERELKGETIPAAAPVSIGKKGKK